MPDVKEKGATLGYRYVGGSPDKLDAFLKQRDRQVGRAGDRRVTEVMGGGGVLARLISRRQRAAGAVVGRADKSAGVTRIELADVGGSRSDHVVAARLAARGSGRLAIRARP